MIASEGRVVREAHTDDDAVRSMSMYTSDDNDETYRACIFNSPDVAVELDSNSTRAAARELEPYDNMTSNEPADASQTKTKKST